jgi:hypothetical protein
MSLDDILSGCIIPSPVFGNLPDSQAADNVTLFMEWVAGVLHGGTEVVSANADVSVVNAGACASGVPVAGTCNADVSVVNVSAIIFCIILKS